MNRCFLTAFFAKRSGIRKRHPLATCAQLTAAEMTSTVDRALNSTHSLTLVLRCSSADVRLAWRGHCVGLPFPPSDVTCFRRSPESRLLIRAPAAAATNLNASKTTQAYLRSFFLWRGDLMSGLACPCICTVYISFGCCLSVLPSITPCCCCGCCLRCCWCCLSNDWLKRRRHD